MAGITFRSGRSSYQLRYRMDSDHNARHISNVQAYSPINGEKPPFGYRAVFCLDQNAEQSAALWLCFTTNGASFITEISVEARESFISLMKTPSQHSATLPKPYSTLLYMERRFPDLNWEHLPASNPMMPFLFPLLMAINSTELESAIFALDSVEAFLKRIFDGSSKSQIGELSNWLLKTLSGLVLAHCSESFYEKFIDVLTTATLQIFVNFPNVLQPETIMSALFALFQVDSRRELNRGQWLHDIAVLALSRMLQIDSSHESTFVADIVNDSVSASILSSSEAKHNFAILMSTNIENPSFIKLVSDWLNQYVLDKDCRSFTTILLFISKLSECNCARADRLLIGLEAMKKLISSPIFLTVVAGDSERHNQAVLQLIRDCIVPTLSRLVVECVDEVLPLVLDVIVILLTDYFYCLFIPLSIFISSCLCPLIRIKDISLNRRFRIMQALFPVYDSPSKLLLLFRELDHSRPDLSINPVRNLLESLSALSPEIALSSDDILRRKFLQMIFDLTKSLNESWISGLVDDSSNPQEMGLFAEGYRVSERNGPLAAIRFLRENDVAESGPESIITFLLNHPSPDSVGEVLGGTSSVLLAPEEETRRLNYLSLFSYGQDDIIQSMRVLFGGIGFMLPSEAQQIERILHTFSTTIFYKRLPELFGEPDSATVLTYLLLMHNTGAHNPKLKSSDRIPLPVFLSALSNTSCRISEQELIVMYEALLTQPFAPLSPQLIAESICQKTIAKLRLQSGIVIFDPNTRRHRTKFGSDVIGRCAAMCLHLLVEPLQKNMSYDDMRSIVFCVGSLKHILTCAVAVNRVDVVNKTGDGLLELCFPNQLDENEVAQKTRTSWIQMLSEVVPEMSNTLSQRIDAWIKRMVLECNMKKLNQLQSSMQGEYDINLVEPNRKLLAQGSLRKRRRRGLKDDRRYDIFLFSDVFIYGTSYCVANGDVRINVHRVMQVAYCNLIDFDGTPNSCAFSLVNPQKEVVFIGDSIDDKERWTSEIGDAISSARSARCSMIGSLLRSMERNNSEVEQGLIHLLSTTSAFLGKRLEHRGKIAVGVSNRSTKSTEHCKLCLRSFARFHGRRKRICISCNDVVCSKCLLTEPTATGNVSRCICCSAQLRRQTSFLYRQSCKLPCCHQLNI